MSDWIDPLKDKIKSWEQQYDPVYKPNKHPNRFSTERVQLEKRLNLLLSRLHSADPERRYRPYRYLTPDNPLSLIATDYDIMLEDVWMNLSYLIALDRYTASYTKNRWYYSRKNKAIHTALSTKYNPCLYSFRDEAWEYRLQAPHLQRKSLNEVLFYDLYNHAKENC